ncbi:MAG: hypothetical protein A2Y34_09430 [Spirochaetes bacterium GWC1_27_15]|nr:MAG: hypothetical protein A2Y34_09430 [Spirochaetes bacterium GWC1_27_15]
MEKKYLINVCDKLKDLRADVAITKKFPDITRSNLKNHLKVLQINGKEGKLSYKCRQGDKIYVEISHIEENNDILPENIPLDIVYEDDNYIVINKKYGMVTHPAKGNYTGTLLNALLGLQKNLSTVNESFRYGIVHRLDKETSGLIIVAKNNEAHLYLTDLFKRRKIIKRYKAIVKGFFTPSKTTIINNIGRSRTDRKKMTVLKGAGKRAVTQVKVMKHINNYSFLKINLKTGRTHQIRVHLSHLGYPIVGDSIYSRKDTKLQNASLCLVSYRLAFKDKFSGKVFDFRLKKLPPHFKEVFNKIK